MLGDGEVAPGEGEVVIGGKQGDQAEGEAADRLGETEARSRAGQEGGVAGNSGGISGSSLPGGVPTALGGGDTGLGGDGWRGLQRINATTGLISSQASDAAEVLAIGHAGHPSPSSRQERGAIAPRKRMRDQPGLVQKTTARRMRLKLSTLRSVAMPYGRLNLQLLCVTRQRS